MANIRSEAGLPDRILIHRQGMWLVEFKGTATRVRDVQRLWARFCPQPVYVVRCPCYIETPEGELLCEFDGTGRGLLAELIKLNETRE